MGFRTAAFTAPPAYKYIQRIYTSGVNGDGGGGGGGGGISADFASGLYSTSVYLGGALSSLSIVVNEGLGWRATCAGVGLVAAAAAAANQVGLVELEGTVEGKGGKGGKGLEASQGRDKNRNGGSSNILASSQAILLQNPLIYLATFFRFCAGLAIGVWGAAYVKGAFPEMVGQVSREHSGESREDSGGECRGGCRGGAGLFVLSYK